MTSAERKAIYEHYVLWACHNDPKFKKLRRAFNVGEYDPDTMVEEYQNAQRAEKLYPEGDIIVLIFVAVMALWGIGVLFL